MLPGYQDGIHQADGIPVIFPLTEDEEELNVLADMCDGFLFTGGHDVDPEIYHEEPLEGMISICRQRDRMEEIVFRKALKDDKPVLGICRGIQFINAVLGGTLYQDLPFQHPSMTEHHQRPPYDIPVHDVIVEKQSPLYQCLKTERLSVNSYHHQAVKALAQQLAIMAVSPDGIAEAAYMPEKHFVWAVQWHPEYSWKTDEYSRSIFRAFVKAAESRIR